MRKEELKRYLEIYRSVEGYEEVEEYLKVLERGPKGSFEQVLSAIFEAVIEAEIDPSDVDLRKFLRAYRKVIKRREDVDYFFAGRIILYSWEIILMETREILRDLLPGDEEMKVKEFEENREEIIPVISRKERRPITLLDLLEAVKKANEIINEKKRGRKRRRSVPLLEFSSSEVTHEDIEMEIKQIYEKLKKKKGKVSFSEVCHKEDPIVAFIALLFLAFEGKVLLWEKENEIIIEVI